jgi:hypothetical protein
MAMNKVRAGFAAALAASVMAFALVGTTTPASAAVYCKTVGYPKGCVVRARPVVYCTRPGYPRACVVR